MRSFITTLILTTAVATATLLPGCQTSSSPAGTAAKLYDVRGKIVSLDAEKKVVTLEHEDIPGLMKAMTMEFAVADAKTLDGLKAGDAVRGKIKAEGGTHTVTSLEKK